ncbi:ribonuclease P protein component [Defluviitalea saccharophila]|jgi:ribonuclease P protein component|uniref:Ribonuclease P protein component n=1 Tax=Defluviitalea saccharophila TaxID=879970 RepID=A0ABZ2Y138_9FIRM|nr:ribonuclease P protein component [Candidatus Epulonipiscium sp.]
MKYTESLKKNFQFKIVYTKGNSIANRLLVMYRLKNGKDINRLGISVSRKVGNSVVRNRITRLIKESYRHQEDNIKLGWDIVIIARIPSKESDYNEISKALVHLLKKAGLFL